MIWFDDVRDDDASVVHDASVVRDAGGDSEGAQDASIGAGTAHDTTDSGTAACNVTDDVTADDNANNATVNAADDATNEEQYASSGDATAIIAAATKARERNSASKRPKKKRGAVTHADDTEHGTAVADVASNSVEAVNNDEHSPKDTAAVHKASGGGIFSWVKAKRGVKFAVTDSDTLSGDTVADGDIASDDNCSDASVTTADTQRDSFLRHVATLGVRLFAVTAAAALLMAGMHALTAEQIYLNRNKARLDAVASVLPPFYIAERDGFEYSGVTLTAATNAASSHADINLAHAYCVDVVAQGYAGEINLLVGVELLRMAGDGDEVQYVLSVTGVSVLAHQETAGVSRHPELLSQFVGQQGGIELNGEGDNGVDAMSGATVSSRAMVDGVNRALDIVDAFVAERTGG